MLKFIIISFLAFYLLADDNNSTKKDTNSTKKTVVKKEKKDENLTKQKLLQKHLEEQMKKEKKYAKEKTFYSGRDYNLSEHQVDPKSLKHIKTIEPDYDFDMDTGVYD